MIQLFFPVVIAEMLVILLLLFRTPLRKFLVMALDRVKRGRGPVIVKTIAATIFVLFLSTVKSIIDVSRRELDAASTDQARHLLDASLMGFILFLGLIVDRIHHYIREIRLLRKVMIANKKHDRSFDESKLYKGDFKAMSAEIANLKNKVQTLVPEPETTAETD